MFFKFRRKQNASPEPEKNPYFREDAKVVKLEGDPLPSGESPVRMIYHCYWP